MFKLENFSIPWYSKSIRTASRQFAIMLMEPQKDLKDNAS